jgi:hypothetical protein
MNDLDVQVRALGSGETTATRGARDVRLGVRRHLDVHGTQPDDADLEALLKRDTFVAMSPERGEAMLFLRERSAFADTAATDEVAE